MGISNIELVSLLRYQYSILKIVFFDFTGMFKSPPESNAIIKCVDSINESTPTSSKTNQRWKFSGPNSMDMVHW